jgi:hypothetical protein
MSEGLPERIKGHAPRSAAEGRHGGSTAPDIHSLAGAFALDALDAPERVAFTGHVAQCEVCRHEVAELRETAARLADDTWATPPVRMREQVMARIRVTRQEAPGAPRTRAPRARRQPWRHRTGILVAASFLIVVGLAGYAGVQAVQGQRERARIEAVLAAPDAALHTVAMQGGGHVTVVTSPARDAAVVLMAQAPPPGAERAYQLWLISGDTPRSAGVLAAGQTEATRYLTGLSGVDSLGVTNEPASGSAAPTTAILGQVSLQPA